jgi:hypothetical protein
MIRLVQLQGPGGRRLARAEEPHLVLIEGCGSVYELAQACVQRECGPVALLDSLPAGERIRYDAVYAGTSPWQVLPSADHPGEPARCLVSGAGLTHMASARNRQAMHGKPEDLTDSMRMYRSGLEGGRPAEGEIGVAPEWFYKGNGAGLRAHNQPLDIPEFAEDGGEEPDLTYALEEGRRAGVDLTTCTSALRRFEEAAQGGWGDRDLSAVVEPLRK